MRISSDKWTGKEVDKSGKFVRQKNRFDTPFGEEEGQLPVEAGRYRLLWAPVCPWAHRSIIVRKLLGLEDVISVGKADPKRPNVSRSDWAFTLDEGDVDPVLGIHYISEVYLNADPDYQGRFTVPALVDLKTKKVVNNDYFHLTLYFETAWKKYHKPGAPDLYPEELREEINALNDIIFREGILRPTQGTVKVKGKIAPLIELGAGFDGDLTGEENVYLNGALLGYSQSEMKKNYRDIVEFSELENFMNVPVKNYSSGMLSRLAFAIATIGIPDILIVDEVLSVGDFRFQKKCEDRIKKMQESGTTVLFVSHSIEQVKKICNKIVWLDHGKVRMYGNTREVCEEYEKI